MSFHPKFEHLAKIGRIILCVADASDDVTIAHTEQNICDPSQVAFTSIRIELAQRIKKTSVLLGKVGCSPIVIRSVRTSMPQPSAFPGAKAGTTSAIPETNNRRSTILRKPASSKSP